MIPARARGTWRLVAASLLFTASVVSPAAARAQTSPAVRVVTDSAGSRLQVDGRDFLVKGMNWDYVPIGENFSDRPGPETGHAALKLGHSCSAVSPLPRPGTDSTRM